VFPRWLGLLPVVVMAGCTGGVPDPVRPSPSAPPPCRPDLTSTALPEWARAGFRGDGSGIPHVMSRRGDIVGVLFGRQLHAPPARDRNNKILWVSRVPLQPGDPLRITAVRDGTSEPVQREVAGGPGPSTVDLPAAGCWRLSLSWSGHTDTMDLEYTPPPA
jgi:hypothetical protein